MSISLSKGRRVALSKVDAFADGVAVKTVFFLFLFVLLFLFSVLVLVFVLVL